MKTCRAFLVVASLLFASRAPAGIRPSFNLEACGWDASHIVVATEGEAIDGKVAVLESWKGDLLPGEIISVPELASFKARSAREINPGLPLLKSDSAPKKYITGSRMILFLKKKATGKVEWEPASSWGGMNVSVLWIEGDRAYAFIQMINPGPSLLTEFGKSEQEVRDRTFDVMRLHESLDAAVANSDPSSRAEALQPFTESALFFVSHRAFTELE
jgi:hypothetical protein